MIIETVLTILLSIAVMHIVVLHAQHKRVLKFISEYNSKLAGLLDNIHQGLDNIDKECDKIIESIEKQKRSCHSADTDKET